MTPNTDLQAESISSGLQRLQELLEKPVATSALELSRNAAAFREYEVLRRLHKSLLQYVQRNRTLFYAGVLGHFSAGKSSTINSILDAWDTKNERVTDLNPTDTTITLITQEKNASSLLGVIKEGHVTIRLEPIESPILDEIVLVDTPGTGDPQFIEEVARDFLPICDLILFVFSAASPLDKSDVPLLLELHNRLPFIPIHFIVTRADELRKDSDAPLTEENLDLKKTENFLNIVVTRVNTLLAPQVYLSSSFSLIDNRSKFRLDQLRGFLESRCDSSNPQTHVAMHLNKLHFYRSNSKALRDFFSGILEKKLDELTRIVSAAERNIDRYQQLVQISNSNLTKNWMEHAAAISITASTALELVKAVPALPETYTAFRSVAQKRAELVQEINRSAKYHAVSIASSLKAQLNGTLQQHLYNIQKSIGETAMQDLSADIHAKINAPIILAPDLHEMQSPAALYRQAFELREAEADALRDAAGDVRRSLTTIYEQSSHGTPQNAASQAIEAAKASLKTDLAQFFQNVELYRSGVFSHTTKESIATLGIGAKLDALEVEFTEEDKEEFARSASSDLFPGSDDLIQSASSDAAILARKAAESLEDARSVRTERPEENRIAIIDQIVLAREKLSHSLQSEIQSELDRLCGELSLSIAELIVSAKNRYDAELILLNKARFKRYSLAFAITAFLFGFGSFVYYQTGKPTPSTILGEGALNLVCGGILEAIVLFGVRIKENIPKLLEKTREQVRVKLTSDIKEKIDENLAIFKVQSLNEHIVTSKLAVIYAQGLDTPSTAWAERASQTLQSLQIFWLSCTQLRAAYSELVEKTRQEASQYFVDSSRNLEVLNRIAGRIKSKAIEPSFDLLAATKDELSTVKIEVDDVVFD